MSRYIIIISVIFFGLLGWQATTFAQTPIPDIKVNGSDGPITLTQSDTLTVTVALDNKGITDNADWWLAADTPLGIYFYTFEGWITDWLPAYQGPLFYLDTYEVFSTGISGLPAGSYTFYFGVDTYMDGNVTWDSVYYDTMVVNVVTSGGGTGNISAQEVGDAIYRPKHSGIEDHAGLYYRYEGGDPSNLMNHWVIHIPGAGDMVTIARKYHFINGLTYLGAYTTSPTDKLLSSKREEILSTALKLVNRNIEYVGHKVLELNCRDEEWTGDINQIARIRCDGVVEYCYERNGIMVWGLEPGHYDITIPSYLVEHNHPLNFLTPSSQRGASDVGYTQMRPSQPDNPTMVSNLISTTHYENGYPIDPEYKRIAIEWDDATDEQSGIWGYYIRVDSNEISIPDHNDYVKEKVDIGKPLFEDLEGYKPEWECPVDLPDGMYYVHIRSIDNAGNWGDDTPENQCTAHLGPLCIGECQREWIVTVNQTLTACCTFIGCSSTSLSGSFSLTISENGTIIEVNNVPVPEALNFAGWSCSVMGAAGLNPGETVDFIVTCYLTFIGFQAELEYIFQGTRTSDTTAEGTYSITGHGTGDGLGCTYQGSGNWYAERKD